MSPYKTASATVPPARLSNEFPPTSVGPTGGFEPADWRILARQLREDFPAKFGGSCLFGQIVLDDVIQQQQRDTAPPGSPLGLCGGHEADVRQLLKFRCRGILRRIGKLDDGDERPEQNHTQTDF